ncbi:MAG: cation diffusion facilitator family transporter, partial [Gammaproteobacteria bacterium]|nr:cation diffusion facilitator family transporter [Gammaproteobacteria bacterium]
MSGHHHDNHDHHHHHHGPDSGGKLIWALVITLGFAVAEAIGGWISGSLALMGDAGHMVTDSTALAIAAFAAALAKRPPSAKHSYGLLRAEAVAALFNGLFMMAVVMAILFAAIERFENPVPVSGVMVMVIAAIGLVVNLLVAFVLTHGAHGHHDLNTRGALLHVLGDLLGSVAALASGAVVYFTNCTL